MSRRRHKSVTLSDELEALIRQLVAGGGYANASEVVRAALRSLEREHLRHELSLATIVAPSTVREDLDAFLSAAVRYADKADPSMAADLRALQHKLSRPALRRAVE